MEPLNNVETDLSNVTSSSSDDKNDTDFLIHSDSEEMTSDSDYHLEEENNNKICNEEKPNEIDIACIDVFQDIHIKNPQKHVPEKISIASNLKERKF